MLHSATTTPPPQKKKKKDTIPNHDPSSPEVDNPYNALLGLLNSQTLRSSYNRSLHLQPVGAQVDYRKSWSSAHTGNKPDDTCVSVQRSDHSGTAVGLPGKEQHSSAVRSGNIRYCQSSAALWLRPAAACLMRGSSPARPVAWRRQIHGMQMAWVRLTSLRSVSSRELSNWQLQDKSGNRSSPCRMRDNFDDQIKVSAG